MSGIVFMKTRNLQAIRHFYRDRIGCSIWLEQPDCLVFRHGNLLIGFCEREEISRGAMLTFFYESREEVDEMFVKLKDISRTNPEAIAKYEIYRFFASDPEERELEFQSFDHPVSGFRSGDELLLSRRSVRQFRPDPIPQSLLDQILDLARFAPTARNTQGYYFQFISDPDLLKRLAGLRESSSAPIGRAPMAVAIAADPGRSPRHIQDACIAAYHLILAAWHFGLGTCWIASMDRDDAKEMLNIPKDHYIATITPIGYPAPERLLPPKRMGREHFLKTE